MFIGGWSDAERLPNLQIRKGKGLEFLLLRKVRDHYWLQ